MGGGQQLQALEEAGDVNIEDRMEGRGCSMRYWGLTGQSRTHFADRHGELTVQLLDSVKIIFGDQGLDQLIDYREQSALSQYSVPLCWGRQIFRHVWLYSRNYAQTKVIWR